MSLKDMLARCFQCGSLCTPESELYPGISLCIVCNQRERRLNHRDPWMGDVLADRWRVMFQIADPFCTKLIGMTWEWPEKERNACRANDGVIAASVAPT